MYIRINSSRWTWQGQNSSIKFGTWLRHLYTIHKHMTWLWMTYTWITSSIYTVYITYILSHLHLIVIVRLSCSSPGPRRPSTLATLPDPSLSYGHVKAKKEIVPQRGGAPGRPVGRPDYRRRATTWRQQTVWSTGQAAAPRTLRPGRPGPARCAAAPRNTSGQWTNRLPKSIWSSQPTSWCSERGTSCWW